MSNYLWQPNALARHNSNLGKFIDFINVNEQLSFNEYTELYQWSINNISKFWDLCAQFTKINFSSPPKQILNSTTSIKDAIWFKGAKLNFAENLLSRKNSNVAIISYDEAGNLAQTTYNELTDEVAKFANGLKSYDVQPSDRVVAIMPNVSTTVVAMLGTSAIGAVWSSCSPEFGDDAIINRLRQIKPKVLLTTLEYQYSGKNFNITNKINKIIKALPSLELIITLQDCGKIKEIHPYSISYKDFLSSNTDIQYYQGDFDHPLYILYSSGTTGKPKCIVHGAGGTLLQHTKELILHTNLQASDTIFYYTSTGWMMWNWLVSSLQAGASIVLYNGSPIYPKYDTLLELIEKFSINIFGVSAKYLSVIEQQSIQASNFNLSSLRTILSTGSPLLEHNFNYVYSNIKKDVCLSSISGGTDIVSCFALGNPLLPVSTGHLQCRGLAMAVEVFNDNSDSIINKKGELVCTKPFPSRPIYFWDDKNDTKYYKTYYARFPNIWHHGDYATLYTDGSMRIMGRSDTTLNPGGIRIGTAEIYQLLEKNPLIIDSIVAGKNIPDDIEIHLFVVLNDTLLTQDIIDYIKVQIKKHLSPRHIPHYIHKVKDIPRTLNDKKVEKAVSDILNGRSPTNTESLKNSECLQEFNEIAQEHYKENK